ncbi:MAG: hypothetical protein ABEK59_11720 [Halobacteria archaeon]
MTTSLHDTGEEFIIDTVFRQDTIGSRPGSLSVGLYNDATDSLSDSSDIGGISTEPAGASYSRQTASLDSGDYTNSDSGGDWQTVIADQTFDTSDSSQDVDSYFVVVNFQSDDTNDGSSTDHLFWTGDLDQTYNLNSVDSFTLSGAGLSVS